MKPLPPILLRAVAAARAERPTPAVRNETLVALGVAPRPRLGLWMRLGGGIGLAAIAMYLALPPTPNASDPRPTPALAIPSQLGTQETTSAVAPSAPSASTALAIAPHSATAPPKAVPRPSIAADAAPAEPSLADEVAALDVASRWLSGGRCLATLNAVRDYHARFPKQRLSGEFELLEIDAVGRAGDRDRARSLATHYLETHPETPYRARVAAWTGDGTTQTGACIDSVLPAVTTP